MNDTPKLDKAADNGSPAIACFVSSLLSLAEMWEELGKVCGMVRNHRWLDEKLAYEECAKELREVMVGNLKCIEEINPPQTAKNLAPPL